MNEINIITFPSLNLYVMIQNSSDLFWNYSTSVFEAINLANWANYTASLTASSLNSSTNYTYSLPTLVSDTYSLWIYKRLGSTPSDTDGLPMFYNYINWNGSSDQSIVAQNGIPDAKPATAGGLPTVNSNNEVNVIPSSGQGTAILTATVQDTPNLIPNATVSIMSTGGSLVSTALSDSNGIAVLQSNPGTYIVTCIASNYTSPSPSSITLVSGNNVTTLNLTINSIPSPTNPDLCNCSGLLSNEDGIVIGGTVIFNLTTPPSVFASGLIVKNHNIQAVSNSSGVLINNDNDYIPLYQGGIYNIISGNGSSFYYTVPTQSVSALPPILG